MSNKKLKELHAVLAEKLLAKVKDPEKLIKGLISKIILPTPTPNSPFLKNAIIASYDRIKINAMAKYIAYL